MKDLTISLDHRPGALAEMGEVLGRAGVSIEGGGAWVVGGAGVAHFLFEDGSAARKALESGADAVIFDLEDSVPVAAKSEARRLVAGAIDAAERPV